jgi:hypothetical protein
MSSQTTLDANAPRILDATCSYKHRNRIPRWPAHATIRIDIRPEVRPDIVMDARKLDFPDYYFDKIYCDPPHLFRRSDNGLMQLRAMRRLHPDMGPLSTYERFSYWHTRQEWLDFVSKSMPEFLRCLMPNGKLHYKLTESKDMNVSDLLGLGFSIKLDRVTLSKGISRKMRVHWLTMKPKALGASV